MLPPIAEYVTDLIPLLHRLTQPDTQHFAINKIISVSTLREEYYKATKALVNHSKITELNEHLIVASLPTATPTTKPSSLSYAYPFRFTSSSVFLVWTFHIYFAIRSLTLLFRDFPSLYQFLHTCSWIDTTVSRPSIDMIPFVLVFPLNISPVPPFSSQTRMSLRFLRVIKWMKYIQRSHLLTGDISFTYHSCHDLHFPATCPTSILLLHAVLSFLYSSSLASPLCSSLDRTAEWFRKGECKTFLLTCLSLPRAMWTHALCLVERRNEGKARVETSPPCFTVLPRR